MTTIPLLHKSTSVVQIPPTPGPIRADALNTQWMDRFNGIIWIDEHGNIDDYLRDYDFWEKYRDDKTYSKRPYLAINNGRVNTYESLLCIYNTIPEKKYYVLAKKITTEVDGLVAACPCWQCVALPFNPIKYIGCQYCHGCLKAGNQFADSSYISEAKKYQHSLWKRPSWLKMKIIEIILIALILYLFW